MKNNVLGNNIKLLRESHSLTQMELSRILNISNTTLSQYEAGNRVPNDDVKIKIADYFNVSVDFLLGRDFNLVTEYKLLSNKNKNFLDDIENLSSESKKELQKYIQLLKLKDTLERDKE